ncbi:20225_t:CDS:2 [Gigaspora rosea]|nr:20225_t:CDS:2 [Gigaspora rosea]
MHRVFLKSNGLFCAYFIQHLENDQTIQDTLKSIIDEPSIALQDPSIVHTKGHTLGAPNNQKVNSIQTSRSQSKALTDPI